MFLLDTRKINYPIIVARETGQPTPVRAWDWEAHFDDYDGAPDAGHQCAGAGKNELLAVDELYRDFEGWFDEALCAHRQMFVQDLYPAVTFGFYDGYPNIS